DNGDGFIALEQVAFGEVAAPEPEANQLIIKLLADLSVETPAALVQKYEALLREVFATWPDNKIEPDRAADVAAIVNWVLDQRLPAGDSVGQKIEEFATRAAELAARQREFEAQLAPPRQAIAFADGTAENEHVFIRGSYKTPGEEVPRRFLEVLGGTRHDP